MKIPKKIRKYCPKCKKHVEVTVSEAKQKTRSSVHPQSIGSKLRMRLRGLRRGFGNQNKYSKPAISKFKRTGAKQSKKHPFVMRCTICNKAFVLERGRAKKVELV
ncbi:MAG: 50S ribosomal protein L44e [archaeon]